MKEIIFHFPKHSVNFILHGSENGKMNVNCIMLPEACKCTKKNIFSLFLKLKDEQKERRMALKTV